MTPIQFLITGHSFTMTVSPLSASAAIEFVQEPRSKMTKYFKSNHISIAAKKKKKGIIPGPEK